MISVIEFYGIIVLTVFVLSAAMLIIAIVKPEWYWM